MDVRSVYTLGKCSSEKNPLQRNGKARFELKFIYQSGSQCFFVRSPLSMRGYVQNKTREKAVHFIMLAM